MSKKRGAVGAVKGVVNRLRKGSKPEEPEATEEMSQSSDNVVDFPTQSGVGSETESEIVNSDNEGLNIMTTLTLNTKPRKGSSLVFDIPGTVYKVKFPRNAFNGQVPDSIGVDYAFQGKAPKAKLSKEERKAQRAAMTPQDVARAAQERAAKAAARAAKLAAAAGL